MASWKRPMEQTEDAFSYIPQDTREIDERTEREFTKLLRTQN